jgi:thioredoxin 1
MKGNDTIMVIAVTKDNFEKEVLKSTKPVIIDIYAVWCGPCQQVKPIFESLSKEMPEYVFASINVDEARDLAIQYGVTSIPTFIFIKDGELKGKEVGPLGKDGMKERIAEYLG